MQWRNDITSCYHIITDSGPTMLNFTSVSWFDCPTTLDTDQYLPNGFFFSTANFYILFTPDLFRVVKDFEM